MRPFPRRLAAGTVVALVLAVTAACGSDSPAGNAASPAQQPSTGTAVDIALPQRLMDMPLTDSAGKTVHLSDFAGKTVVVSDSMTLCQEACPIDTATLVQTATRVASGPAASDIVFLTITVDPQRDTPAQLAAYRKQYVGGPGNLPQWRLLTGSPDDIHALWKQLGVYWQKTKPDDVAHNWRTGQRLTYDIAHSDEVFFIDGDGHERYLLDGIPSLGGDDTVPAKIRAFENDKGHHNEQRTKGWTAQDAVDVLSWLRGSAVTQ